MTEQERINELVAMLDQFVEGGGGHIYGSGPDR